MVMEPSSLESFTRYSAAGYPVALWMPFRLAGETLVSKPEVVLSQTGVSQYRQIPINSEPPCRGATHP